MLLQVKLAQGRPSLSPEQSTCLVSLGNLRLRRISYMNYHILVFQMAKIEGVAA